MAYKISCADTGADCAGSFTTETKEELMEHVKIHAQHSHPDMTPPPPEAIATMIKEV